MKLDYEMNDPADPESIYTRSDHYSYASKGIPIIFYTTGLHRDYHYVTDEVSKIEFPKMAHITQLVYATGMAGWRTWITSRRATTRGRGRGRARAGRSAAGLESWLGSTGSARLVTETERDKCRRRAPPEPSSSIPSIRASTTGLTASRAVRGRRRRGSRSCAR